MVISEIPVDSLTSQEVAQVLGVNLNNLRQIQFRGSLKWVKRVGRKVYYLQADTLAYQEKRNKRKSAHNLV